VNRFHPLLAALLWAATIPSARAADYPPPGEVRAAFETLLDRPKVPLDPRLRDTSHPDGLIVETLDFASEKHADGSLERVPALIVHPQASNGKRPAVIVLHGTGGNKEGMRSWLDELAHRGFVAVAIDARYHGDRSGGLPGAEAYQAAIRAAWKTPDGEPHEHPFYYDTCWDLWRLVDYLQTRDDVDPERIGMMGISMGGIETWLAASVDERVKVAAPVIAVQSFRWSLDHDRWQGRAHTIAAAHEAAARQLGETRVNAEVCRALWSKIIPGILDQFDCPSMLRLFADRPLLIVNGENDPNCPLEGAALAFDTARASKKSAGAPETLKILVAKGVAHSVTDEQHQAILEWFTQWLKP
jgi:dienelactone hydrolase